MLPWILVSQVLEPSKACIPAWDLPYLQQQASILVESKPLVGLTSPGPTSAPIHVGGRARGPEHPNAKNPVRQLAPSSKVPYQDPPSDPIPKERHPSAIQKSSAQHSLSQFSSKHLSWVWVQWPESFSKHQFLTSGAAFTPANSSPVCLCAWPGRSPTAPPVLPLSFTSSQPPDFMVDFPHISRPTPILNAWLWTSGMAEHPDLPLVR